MKPFLSLVVGLFAATFAINTLAADYSFKFQSSDPSGVKNFQIKEAWAARVEKMTAGRVEIDILPVGSVADLKGLKLRAPEGLVQSVFAAAGASPVNLPGSEVYTGLSKGVIDAADYTVFSTNHSAGLHEVAQHPVYPGFHSLPLLEVVMDLDEWKAVNEAREDPSITIHDWSAEERKKFRAIAREQWKIYAEQSPNAQKVYESVSGFLESQGLL